MRYTLRAVAPLLAMVAVALLAPAPVDAQGNGDVAGLIAALNSRDGAVRDGAVAELSLRGPGVLDAVFGVMERRGPSPGQRAARVAAERIVQQASGWAPAREATRVLVEQARTRTEPHTRRAAVDLLSYVASADDVPLIAGWLSDPELADSALFVLARIPDGAAVPVLSEQLKTAIERKSPLAVPIALALGETRHPSAAPALAACLTADKPIALAALRALGRIPSTDAEPAVRALLGAKDAELRGASRRAYLAMGEALVGAGNTEAALPLFRQMGRIAGTSEETCGALRGITECEGERAVPELLGALSSKQPSVRGAACDALERIPGCPTTHQIAGAWSVSPPEVRALLLRVLGTRGCACATPTMLEGARSGVPEVRLAALEGLGRIGSPDGASVLLSAALGTDEAVRNIALRSLARTRGAATAGKIVRALGRPGIDPTVRAALLADLGARKDRAAAAVLLAAVGDPDKNVSGAALTGLAALADPASIPGLLRVLPSVAADRKGAIRACLVAFPPAVATPVLLDALNGAPPAATAETLEVLAGYADPSLATVFERYLAAPDEPVVVAALHGLGALNDDSAAELVRKHSSDKRPLVRSAAFAGMLRVAEARNPQDAAALDVYTQAVKTEGLGDPEKRRALLGLARVADPASLPVLQPVLDKPGPLGAEVAAAANAIAPKLKDKPRAIALLRRVLEITTARDEVVAAAKALRDLGETVDIAASGGFITGWWVTGPMAPRKDLREKDALDPAKPVDVSQPVAWGDAQFPWKFAHVDDPLGLLDLEVACARRDDVGCYVYAEVQSDTERDVTLRIGSDDDVVLWVNGKQVHSFIGDRGWTLDQDTAHAHLIKGTNRFLCKVLQGGGQWSVSVRLVDADSKPVVLPQKRP